MKNGLDEYRMIHHLSSPTKNSVTDGIPREESFEKKKYYVDICLQLGLSSSCMIFVRF